MSYILDYSYQLKAGQGSSDKAQNLYVIAHETGNDENVGANSAQNEAIYMHNNYFNAYTTHIVGWDRVYVIGEPGYVSWGAGNANPFAPAQVELAQYSDPVKQKQAYAIYVELLHDLAKQFGIPLTLDVGGAGVKGIKSHKWVSDNIWGDHQDPYGYLTKIGISKQQFERDLAVGSVGAGTVQPDPNVIKVSYGGLGKVVLWYGNGKASDRYLDKDTRWKVFGTALINGEEMAQVGKDLWLPLRYSDWAYDSCEVTHTENVRGLNGKGKWLNQYFKPKSKWKINGVKIINGMIMYLIGNDVYIPKKYVHVYR